MRVDVVKQREEGRHVMPMIREYWRWYVWSQTRPGKRVATRYVMTEADALATDPTAERVPDTMELREVPSDDHEAYLQSTSAIGRAAPAADDAIPNPGHRAGGDPNCPRCRGEGYVCEDHPDLPWHHVAGGTDTHAAGMNCPRCNPY